MLSANRKCEIVLLRNFGNPATYIAEILSNEIKQTISKSTIATFLSKRKLKQAINLDVKQGRPPTLYLVCHLQHGRPIRSIAKQYNVSAWAITQRILKSDYLTYLRDDHFIKIVTFKVLFLWRLGWDKHDIAKHCWISPQLVLRIVPKYMKHSLRNLMPPRAIPYGSRWIVSEANMCLYELKEGDYFELPYTKRAIDRIRFKKCSFQRNSHKRFGCYRVGNVIRVVRKTNEKPKKGD